MRVHPQSVIFLVAAAAGLFFAGFSTYDFVQHLDRQVHGIHCSFVPGLASAEFGSSGCQATLMSPYSSVLRTLVWGGIPVSLPGMAVFAFLLFRGIDLVVQKRQDEARAWAFLAAASVIPVVASLVMGTIAFVELGAACKLCIGIYISSFAVLGASLFGWNKARSAPVDGAPGLAIPIGERGASGVETREGVLGFGQVTGFVLVPSLVYLIAQPDQDAYIGKCGSLLKPEDPAGIMVPYSEGSGGVPTIEVFDPLCGSCKGTEARLRASGLDTQLDRKLVLFPLDNTCNWSVGSTMHPGACTVSEAILCAGDRADMVIDWAFEHQDEVLAASKADPTAAARLVTAAFPDVKDCLGSPGVKAKLNKSLRWAVSNQLELLTPQIFIDGQKVCNEDTDLGLDYALTRMLADRKAGSGATIKGGAK